MADYNSGHGMYVGSLSVILNDASPLKLRIQSSIHPDFKLVKTHIA
jgi:hypothetical protein